MFFWEKEIFVTVLSMNQTSLPVRKQQRRPDCIPRSLRDANNHSDSRWGGGWGGVGLGAGGVGGVGSCFEAPSASDCPCSTAAMTSLPRAVGQQPSGDACLWSSEAQRSGDRRATNTPDLLKLGFFLYVSTGWLIIH